MINQTNIRGISAVLTKPVDVKLFKKALDGNIQMDNNYAIR